MISAALPIIGMRAPASPLLRRLAAAGAATLLVNGFNFVLGVWLVRYLAPRTFGIWAMLTTLQAIAGVLLTALVAQQMAYTLPRVRHPARGRVQVNTFTSIASWCIAGFVPATAVTLHLLELPVGMVAAGCMFVAAAGIRQHARFHLYAVRRPRGVLAQDVAFVLLAACGVAFAGSRRDLTPLLLALTLANVVAVAWRRSLPMPAVAPARVRRHALVYSRHGARATWSLVTVALSTLSALAPNLALASTGSLAALALVAAPATLLAPVRLVALTFQASLRAEFAAMIHADRRGPTLLLYAGASGAALLACLLLGGVLWAGWDWLSPRVFARGYDAASLYRTTMLAFGIAAVNVVRLPGAVLLNALGVFRFSAATLAIVVPIVLASSFQLAHDGAVTAVLYPALLGEIAVFAAELTVLFRRMR